MKTKQRNEKTSETIDNIGTLSEVSTLVMSLYLKNTTRRDILQRVRQQFAIQYTAKQLKHDINIINQHIKLSTQHAAKSQQAVEIARIEDLVAVAWQEFAASRSPFNARHRVNDDTLIYNGDVKYLHLINDLLIEKRKLLGLYAPQLMQLEATKIHTAEQLNEQQIQAEVDRITKALAHE